MTIWIVFALMTGAAVLAVLWPVSMRPAGTAEASVDAYFYREQLAEIDRDLGRGLISPMEAESAKAEAGRRLLRTGAASAPHGEILGEPGLRRRRAVSAIALSVVPLLALAAYGAFGSPHLPAQPLSARLNAKPEQVDLAAALARIEAHLAQHPDDGRGWEVVAPVYLRSGRFSDAAKAYEAAIRHLGETAPRLASYGEALIGTSNGVVPANARAAFERALRLDPGAVKARFYLAQAAEQDGDTAGARANYGELLAQSPPDAPWAAPVRERLAALPSEPNAEAPAPLGSTDRQAAIRGMVERLAARLDANGGSVEEWSRLARSYAVLGEPEKAKTALDKARSSLADNASQGSSLDALALELNVPTDTRRP